MRVNDVYRPIQIGASADPPLCPVCGARMEWIPQVGRMDAYEPHGMPGGEFDHRLADGTTVHIDSLHKLRQVERDSEQRARNGEGERLAWRDYSQDSSNKDRHTFATSLTDPHGDIAARTANIEAQKARSARLKTQVGLTGVARGATVTARHGTVDD